MRDAFYKLWVLIEKKTGRVISAHCHCFAGMGETCNHIAAALFRLEAMVRLGLTNPSCTSKANQWLPNRTDVVPKKVQDINFNRDDFGRRGRKTVKLLSTPKKNFNPLSENNKKLLDLNDIASALETVSPNSIIHTAVAQPEIDFICEPVTEIGEIKSGTFSIDDVLLMSNSKEDFLANLNRNVRKIEMVTRGQSDNALWFSFRKGVVTASKAHGVVTKMKKVKQGGGGYINMFQLNQNVSGLTYIDPNLPSLKYGREMEDEAAETFLRAMKSQHKNLKLNKCGLYLDKKSFVIGASPDGIMDCNCCPPSCVEIKCPYSINYASPTSLPEGVKLPYINEGSNTLKKNHAYHTQCLVQMGITRLTKSYFVVWSPHGLLIDEIEFDPQNWSEVREMILSYYYDFYLKSIFTN